jgi:hypothetical protein
LVPFVRYRTMATPCGAALTGNREPRTVNRELCRLQNL